MDKRSLLSAAVVLATAAAPLAAQNNKVLHNTQHTSSTTRYSATTLDTLYYMQPDVSRIGYGKAIGWIATLQDQDYQTPESTQFGYVKFAANKTDPDVTTAGLILNATANLTFPQPASGTISAATWTLTLATAVDVPDLHGHRIILPIPKATWPTTDGISIHTQTGTTSTLPVPLQTQLTFWLNTSQQASPYFQPASTLRYGGRYVEPVTQMFIRSTRYANTPEDLFGIEALYPSSTIGLTPDEIGWQFSGSAFKGQFAILLLGGGLLTQPIVTPNLGTFFMLPPTGLVNLAFSLDASGFLKTPTIPIPATMKVKVWSQTAFIDITTNNIRLSDATAFETNK